MKTIVFIHGNSSSSKIFDPIMEDANVNYNKIAIDLPGHGENHNNYSDTDFSIPNTCKRLLKELSSIEGDILLVGNSLGGHLAIEIAPHVNNLKGLVIFGTPPLKKPLNPEEAFISVPALATFLTENPSVEEIETAIGTVIGSKENRKLLISDFTKADGRVRSVLVNDFGENKFDDEFTIFTTLKIPKYIIISEFDYSINPQYLETVKESCTSTCEIIYFDNCGHYPSIEKPEQFSEAIQKIAIKVF
jgi:pimeloyl-ACP methyl ester carboxylesterase